MLWATLLFFCSFLLSLLFTPLIRKIAIQRGWVDQPDNSRKMHKRPIPRVGGIPILLAYGGAFSILSIHAGPSVHHFVWRIVCAALLIFSTGLIDDLVGLKPWQKIVAEGVGALLAYSGGIQIHSLAGYNLSDLLSLPITVAWLIGCTNAFNLIDGLDGLAAGVSFIAALAALSVGLVHGDIGLVIAAAPLAGALLGFLRFNFNPASIFLGDGGSLWIGFMLACYAVIWCQKSTAVLSITAPLMALSIPMLDTGLSITRRFLRGQPIFMPDRGHIHHRLLDRGLSPRRTVLLLYAASALGAYCSVLQSTAPTGIRMAVATLFCVVIWIGVRYLRYQEFEAAVHLLRRDGLRFMVQSHCSLHRYETQLMASETMEQFWHSILEIGRELACSDVELRFRGGEYQEHLCCSASEPWVLHVPVSELEYVRFKCSFELLAVMPTIGPLVSLLRRALLIKAYQFKPKIIEHPDVNSAQDSRLPMMSAATHASSAH